MASNTAERSSKTNTDTCLLKLTVCWPLALVILAKARLRQVEERMEREQVEPERADDPMWSLGLKGRKERRVERSVR